MSQLNIDIIFNGIKINANFAKGLSILAGYSGTGKTLLMNSIELYCKNNKVPCRYFDYRLSDYTEQNIINNCVDAEVILFDNADMYLTNNILKAINVKDKTVIISMKDTSKIETSEACELIVYYNNKELTIEEF